MTEEACLPAVDAEGGSWHRLRRESDRGLLEVTRIWRRGEWCKPGCESGWRPEYAAKHGWEYAGPVQLVQIVPSLDLARISVELERQAEALRTMRDMTMHALGAFHAMGRMIRLLKSENEALRRKNEKEMPCYDPPRDPPAATDEEDVRHALACAEANLCAVLASAERAGCLNAILMSIDWQEAGIDRIALETWWAAHRASDDEQRRAR